MQEQLPSIRETSKSREYIYGIIILNASKLWDCLLIQERLYSNERATSLCESDQISTKLKTISLRDSLKKIAKMKFCFFFFKNVNAK